MGLFDFFKKIEKSDVEKYYEERNKRAENQAFSNNQPITNQTFNNQPVTNCPSQSQFRITVQDVFAITGRGTVITGNIESGFVQVGDTVTLYRGNGTTQNVVVAGIEKFRKMLNVAQAGENVGIMLSGITRKDISQGDILVK